MRFAADCDRVRPHYWNEWCKELFDGTTFGPFDTLSPVRGVLNPVAPPLAVEALPEYLNSVPEAPVSLVACPLMHGTGMWLGAMVPMSAGGTVVLTSKLGLDPDLLWGLVEENKVTDMVIVGDAFARPLLNALDDAEKRGHGYDISSLQRIASSGVMPKSLLRYTTVFGKFVENLVTPSPW